MNNRTLFWVERRQRSRRWLRALVQRRSRRWLRASVQRRSRRWLRALAHLLLRRHRAKHQAAQAALAIAQARSPTNSGLLDKHTSVDTRRHFGKDCLCGFLHRSQRGGRFGDKRDLRHNLCLLRNSRYRSACWVCCNSRQNGRSWFGCNLLRKNSRRWCGYTRDLVCSGSADRTTGRAPVVRAWQRHNNFRLGKIRRCKETRRLGRLRSQRKPRSHPSLCCKRSLVHSPQSDGKRRHFDNKNLRLPYRSLRRCCRDAGRDFEKKPACSTTSERHSLFRCDRCFRLFRQAPHKREDSVYR